MLIRGVVAALLVVRNHSKITSIASAFIICSYSACASKVATAENSQFYRLRDRNISFVLIFRQLLIFRMRSKSFNLFLLECSFHW